MKPTQVLVALAAIAYAAPVSDDTKAKALEIDDDFPLAELEAYFEAHMNGETSEANSLQARQFSASTYNQLTDGTPCRPVTMIYARGTTQAGNVGDPAAVGPVLFNNLASRIGLNNLAVQGVAYAANIAGYLAGGDAAGSRTMANLISRAATQCPSTKIIISGYSQGAQLVHNAAGMLSASVTNRVTAAVTFGDPKQKQAFGTIPSSRTRIFCRAGDNICDGGIIVTPAHSQYQQDAPAAAEWIAARERIRNGEEVTFRPSLIICPVNSLPQTYLEAKENFPDFNLVVFYGIRSTFVDKGAKVIGLGELIPLLDKLDPHSPKTGKTLVITLYTTLSARFIKKQETLFTFKPDKVPPSLQKKKDADESEGEKSYDDDEFDDNDMALARRRKVPVYSRHQVNLDDINIVDDPKIADGNIVWYKRTQKGIKDISFQFVVCDEAQVAKKADGPYNNLLHKFQWRILLWTSGTPLSNSLRDLISPLILVWKALGIKWNPTIGRIGYLPGLYHEDYDPLVEDNEIKGQITKGILHPEFLANNKAAKALLPFWQNEKSHLWMLHPELYKAAGMKHHWGSNLAAWVVRPIFEYVHIRRTMRTPLRLPNGSMTYPGIDLLPPTIVVEEHTFGPQLRPQVMSEGFDLAKRLFKPANDDRAIRTLVRRFLSPISTR
ncbi:hypothetical protein ACHAPY_009418 [Fusarium culmorum]